MARITFFMPKGKVLCEGGRNMCREEAAGQYRMTASEASDWPDKDMPISLCAKHAKRRKPLTRQQINTVMRKILPFTVALLIAGFSANAQPPSKGTYVQAYVDGVQQYVKASVFTIDKDTLNAKAGYCLLQTAPVKYTGVYHVSATLNLKSYTGNPGLQLRFSYTDENGIASAATSAIITHGKASINPFPIHCLAGTAITASVNQVQGLGTMVYDAHADAKQVSP